MAILDQTTYNQYIAEGIRNATGLTSSLGILSGGSMPDFVRSLIVQTISEALRGIDTNIPGNIPGEIFDTVADIMLPFTPSMNKSTLVDVLKSNSVFGQIGGGITNLDTVIADSLNSFINYYERRLLEVSGGVGAVLGALGISGSLSQISEQITGDVVASITASLSTLLSPLELSNISPRVVATFLKGSGEINLFTDLPPSFATVLTNPEISSLVVTVADPLGNVDLDELSPDQRDTFAGAYVKAASGTTESIGALKSLMASTRGTIAGTIDNTTQLPGPNPYIIDVDTIDPEGSFISSIEELEAEMSSITRGISEVILHWSETFTNANLSAAQLTDLTGAGDNAYHLIIRRDGSVERGVPLNQPGKHCELNGHDEHSIGICFVGGLNVSTGASNLYEVASTRSITRSQYNSFYQIMRVFFSQFPGGQALGHMDIDPNMEDPGFDVRDYVYNNFNKLSLYKDPINEPGLSPTDILKKLEENSGIDALEKDPDVMEKKF